MIKSKVAKSFKREIALVGLAFWAFLTYMMFFFFTPERLEALESPYDAVTWSTWTYAAAAFGLHAIATQWGDKG